MTKISLSSIAHFFRTGKWGKDTDTAGNGEIASSTTGVQQKIGNQGEIERFTQNSGIKSEENVPVEEEPKDTQPENTQSENAQPEHTQTQNTQTENAGDRKNSIEELYRELKTSKRGGFHLRSGNSGLYTNVMKYLENIVNGMKEGFSSDERSNMKKFDAMQAGYQHLIDACKAYTKRKPSTAQGKIRQNIVRNILNTAQKDLIGLGGISVEFAALPPEEQAGKTWAELVNKARVTELHVKNLFGITAEKVGEASEVFQLASNTIEIYKEDKTEKKLSGTYFFKPEDEIDLDQKTYSLESVNSILDRYPKLPPADKDILREWAAEQSIELEALKFDEDPQELSQLGKIALKTIKTRIASMRTIYKAQLKGSGIASEGGRINMTRRNVATSRMAALLGLEDLVAKSYEAELYDETTKRKIKGNMMEKAEGMTIDLFGIKRGGEMKGTPAAVRNLVQRDLLNLQVLDILCGQMDRHWGNIMAQTEGDTVIGIKGIDNDGAFGLNTDVAGKHDKRVYDPDTGEMLLPYMDKNLAERILALAPDAVRFSLKGLITDREIEAAVQRLRMMQSMIEKTKEKDEARFLEDSQWNQKTAQALFERGNLGYTDRLKEKKADEFAKSLFKKDSYNDLSKEELGKLNKIIIPMMPEITLEAKNNQNYFAYAMLSTISYMKALSGIIDVPQLEVIPDE